MFTVLKGALEEGEKCYRNVEATKFTVLKLQRMMMGVGLWNCWSHIVQIYSRLLRVEY